MIVATRRLKLDQLTASVALKDLADHGNDLTTLAQALDHEMHSSNQPESGNGYDGGHLFSTIGNKLNAHPTGLSYWNTSLIQPGTLPAEAREMKDRFLRGKPMFAGELVRRNGDYRMNTVLLRMGMNTHAVFEAEHLVIYILEGMIPDMVMASAPGRRLGDVADIGHCGDLIIREMRVADIAEITEVLGHIWTECLAITTDLPGWTIVEFEPTPY